MPNYYNPVSELTGAYESGLRANHYALQNRMLEDKMRSAADAERAMNLYGEYGTGSDVMPDDLRQMFRDQGVPGSAGEPIAARADEARKQKLSNMALAALGIDDAEEQKDAFRFIHAQLSPDEQRQYGDPGKWTRTGVAAFIGNDDVRSMMEQWKARRKPQTAPKTQEKTLTPYQVAELTRTNKEIASARKFVDEQRALGRSDQYIAAWFKNEWSRAHKEPSDAVPFEAGPPAQRKAKVPKAKVKFLD